MLGKSASQTLQRGVKPAKERRIRKQISVGRVDPRGRGGSSGSDFQGEGMIIISSKNNFPGHGTDRAS